MIKNPCPLHPGVVLACILVEEDAEQLRYLAASLNLSIDDLHLLLEGQKDIDEPIAEALMNHGYLVTRVWLDMQKKYDLAYGKDLRSN